MSVCRIMLTDDHELFRSGLRSLIEKNAKFQVVGEARDGEDLLQKLKTIKCDVVILDLSMPNMDGIAAIRNIRLKYPKVKILVLTMQKDAEHFKHAVKNGASGYLLKEDAFDKLVLGLHMVMQGKQFVSPSVATLAAERYIRSTDEVETPSLEILTKRELEILKLIAGGLANKQVAAKLKISIRTVETHRANLTEKLGIKNTAGLVKYALSKGMI